MRDRPTRTLSEPCVRVASRGGWSHAEAQRRGERHMLSVSAPLCENAILRNSRNRTVGEKVPAGG